MSGRRPPTPVTVVVGVDGAGRGHRSDEIAAAAPERVVRIDPHAEHDPELPQRLDDALAGGCPVRSIEGPELAELDEVAATRGLVERLDPLDVAGVAVLVRHQTGASGIVRDGACNTGSIGRDARLRRRAGFRRSR